MILPGKDFWYDWGGANQAIFEGINGLRPGEYYDDAMIALSNIADHHHFFYYMAGLAVFALTYYFLWKVRNRGGTQMLLAAWVGVLLVLGAGYAAEGYVLHHAKDYFSYPRPYIVLSHDTRVLEIRPADDDYHSFPSGHAAFITLMIAGLWPVLSSNMKWLGAALIIGVMWSRMVLGVHFPADVLGGFMLSLIMMLILRYITYRILRRAFGLKC